MGQVSPLTGYNSFSAEPSFFSKQVASEGTKLQVVFDFVFGVVGPILCFVFDPIVFKGDRFFGPLLSPFQLFAYAASVIPIFVLIVWLLLRKQLGSYGPLIGGVFTAAAAFSGLLALLLLPLSVAGLSVYFIGIAGFIPFLTAFAYFRNAIRAFDADEWRGRDFKRGIALLAAFGTFCLPGVLSYQIGTMTSAAVDQLIYGDVNQARMAAERLQWIPIVPQSSLNVIVRAYEREADGRKKAIMKTYYLDATGQDIDRRVEILND